MTEFYYAIGTTLANMTNIETTYSVIANSLQQNRIPLAPPTKRRVQSGASVRNGKITRALSFSHMTQAQLSAFVIGVFGDFTTSSAAVYVTAISTRGFYEPFLVTLDNPYEDEDYQNANGTWKIEVNVPAFGWSLQSVTLTASATVTASQRLVYGDTSGGTIAAALPAAATVTPNTVYSYHKTNAADNFIIDPAGTETIDGIATANLTALNERIDIVSDGVSAWRSVNA